MSKTTDALSHADRGFYVFPLRFSQRQEKWIPWEKGWQQKATRDRATVAAWFDAHPDWNIGIFTGRFGNDKALCAIDVDVKADKPGLLSLLDLRLEGEMPETWQSRTASGGQHHVYVVDAPLIGRPSWREGIDIRSAGNYIVAPGSVRADGSYDLVRDQAPAPCPPWLVAAIGHAKDREAPQPSAVVSLDDERAVRRAREYLRHAEPAVSGSGGNQTTYAVAACIGDYGVSAAQCIDIMAEEWNQRCDPPWDDDDLAEIVRNAYEYRGQPLGVADPRADFTVVDGAPVRRRGRLPAVKFSEIRFKPGARPLVKGWLPEAGTSMVVGATGAGKTHFTLDLALHVALGADWRGLKVRGGLVIYVAGESHGSVDLRLQAAKKKRGLEGAEVPLVLVPFPADLRDDRGDASELVSLVREYSAEFKQPARLVVIDTAARSMAGADENSSKDAGAFIGQIDAIRDQTGAHVLVVHHLGKDENKGARGSSALKAAVDTEITIRDWTAEITKQRDGECGLKAAFGLESVPLGVDADGELVSAPVVVAKSVSEVRRRPPIPAGDAAMAYAVLQREIREKGEPATADVPAPLGALVALESNWRESFVAEKLKLGGVTDRAARKVALRAFQRAGVKLASTGYVGFTQEYAWLL